MSGIHPSTSSLKSRWEHLEPYYQQVKAVILERQHPVTGLLPASTAVTVHGNYTDAWVRDNVYSILAVWGVALAYRKLDENWGRTYELEQSVVKLMRGLLFAMMQQSAKVEQFKQTQDPLNALHAKYHTATATTVVGDEEWGHLQLDATSLYLLMLAQMTASGLAIIYTLDEVNFIQNLVYYIGRAYRTPDYGIWERGNKLNHGRPELNASSVGMAKAALEAMQGLNLFGVRGGQSAVVHVLPDEIARARITLESLLPRESGSKEVDAALLSILGFPAFAMGDANVIELTRAKIIDKLEGNYGCKRFLRDGHQTVIEDTTRLHYEPEELQQFEHIECEWPLFFAYLWLEALFRGETETARVYETRLQALAVERDGWLLLPEVYYVPVEHLEAERQQPGSQPRRPNENVPLVWAQSLYVLGQLLTQGLLKPGDLDPLGRHLRVTHTRHPIVQIALVAEDETLQAELATFGIVTQLRWPQAGPRPSQLEPMQIYPAGELSAIYAEIGRNDKLGLSGRPVRRLRSLTTSRAFHIGGETVLFLPSCLDQQQFYLTLDYHFLVAQIRSELAYIHEHWHEPGRPTVTLWLTHAMFELGHKPIHQSPLLTLLQELKSGSCGSVPVCLGPLYQLLLTAGSERIDDVNGYPWGRSSLMGRLISSAYLLLTPDNVWPLSIIEEFDLEQETDLERLLTILRQSDNLYEQIELLSSLKRLQGLEFNTGLGDSTRAVTVADLLNEIYIKAGKLEHWGIVRRAAGLLEKVDISLSDSVTELLVRQKHIAVGKAYSQAAVIRDPMPHGDIMAKIRTFCSEDVREHALSQEILIYLSVLIKTEPTLFDGLLTLRISYLILLLTSELSHELRVSQDEAYEHLMGLSPFEIKLRLRQVLAGYQGLNSTLFRQESLHVSHPAAIDWQVVPQKEITLPKDGDWLRKRRIDGEINRLPDSFYTGVWQLLRHCRGIVIGDKLERRNRLDSQVVLSEMTPGEQNFALRVNHLLNKIQAPEYRHLTVEALQELAALVEGNPELQFEDYMVLDVLIGHAVRLAWLEIHPERAVDYDTDKASAWQAFYGQPPRECARYVAKALQFLAELAEAEPTDQQQVA
ncbi:glycoside hydrolase family 15 protein [Halomicronema hongdechloris]|uniref:glycoside hydrolase family 15 protein n=1 Tax=Halomicronema hongdechloris TaxID=1209493 RepID=UPI00211AE9EE|nr:glycoside hydrolase family 15 protein [Halomicronema hongdechloris]